MKAYEFPARVSAEGEIRLPEHLLRLIPPESLVRLILLVSEPADGTEASNWDRLTAEQFLAGYSDEDAIYDHV